MKSLMTLFMVVILTAACNGTIDFQKACELCNGVPQPPVIEQPKPCPEVTPCPPEKVCPVCPVCPNVQVETPTPENKDLYLPKYANDGSAGVEYKIDEVQWTGVEKRIYGLVLNNAMQKVSARYNEGICNPNSECIAGLSAEEFFSEVCTELRSQNYRCGKHEQWTDEICFGSPKEKRCQGAHIFNYGGNKVAWAPGCLKDTWKWE